MSRDHAAWINPVENFFLTLKGQINIWKAHTDYAQEALHYKVEDCLGFKGKHTHTRKDTTSLKVCPLASRLQLEFCLEESVSLQYLGEFG